PSSSAAYNVGDVVDTPDSAIKSWRYLGAGEWEPNDAVRYTMGPGVGNRFLTAGDLAVDAHVALRRGSRHIPGTPLLRAPTNTTGVTSTAGAAVVATTRRGRACYEVTFDAGSSNRNAIIPIPSRVYSDKISVTFEVEDANEWNGGNFRLGLFTASGLTNGMRHQYSIGASNAWNGVRVVAPTEGEWSVVGSGSWASTMTHAAFTGVRRSTPATTEPTRIWIYEITEGERNTLPSIIMGADDGHGTWYSSGLPILEKYGIPSYLAYIRDTAIAGGSAMTHEQWRDAVARGHYAVVHGCKAGVDSLRDYFTSFAPYDSPLAAMIADIEYNRDGMISE
ncbi:MAG: hypothetical protein KDE20_27485, partial [Caldilineaceae bacterium]|nr:hypothetical protein [Caldilineaceae bacterium]